MYIEDRSGTYRKSALQLDVEALKQRVVKSERRLSEMAIEIVALTEENRAIKQAGDRMAKRLCLIINSERTPDNASIDAVKNWWQVKKVKEESE